MNPHLKDLALIALLIIATTAVWCMLLWAVLSTPSLPMLCCCAVTAISRAHASLSYPIHYHVYAGRNGVTLAGYAVKARSSHLADMLLIYAHSPAKDIQNYEKDIQNYFIENKFDFWVRNMLLIERKRDKSNTQWLRISSSGAKRHTKRTLLQHSCSSRWLQATEPFLKDTSSHIHTQILLQLTHTVL